MTRREAMGLTQPELAHRIGVHKNTIVAIETDKSPGDPQTKKALADLFGCTLLDLDPPEGFAESFSALQERVKSVERQLKGLEKDAPTPKEETLLRLFRLADGKLQDTLIKIVGNTLTEAGIDINPIKSRSKVE